MTPTELQVLLVQMQFPGMPRLESNISRAWIRQHAADYDALDFNVRVGVGRPLIDGLEPEIALQQTMLSQRRIDIVAHVSSFVDLIEVKDRASLGAIGQLKGYQHLWAADHPQILVRRLLIVARDVAPDVQTVARNEGVEFRIVQPEER